MTDLEELMKQFALHVGNAEALIEKRGSDIVRYVEDHKKKLLEELSSIKQKKMKETRVQQGGVRAAHCSDRELRKVHEGDHRERNQQRHLSIVQKSAQESDGSGIGKQILRQRASVL